mmetsp:Transcript_21566/g.64234  ORF Transcript_21566/g.64234 Transcript_21566/m.64234 type:complete len:651 (+) Transcript_21566:41-1993(+)
MSLRTALRLSADQAGVQPEAPPPTPPLPVEAGGHATSPMMPLEAGESSVVIVDLDDGKEVAGTPTRTSSRKRSLSTVLMSDDFTDPVNVRVASPVKRAPCLDPTEYCSFCCDRDRPERLLTCHLCGNSGHKKCLQFDDRLWARCKSDGKWTCIECKSCAVCESNANDDLMLFCDQCDQGVHMYCLSTPLMELPEGEWLCPACATGAYPKIRRSASDISKFKAQRTRHLNRKSKGEAAAAAPTEKKRGPGRPKGSKNKGAKAAMAMAAPASPIALSKRKGPRSKKDKGKGKQKVELKDMGGRGGAILSPQRVGLKANTFKRRKGEPESEDEMLYEEARRMALDAAARCREDDDSGAGAATDVRAAGSDKSWIAIGSYEVQAWYSAPYPEEYAVLPKLYLCDFCLKYMKSTEARNRHRRKCELHGQPPGTEIYRSGPFQVWEVDGAASKIYCQNLCLLSKLFLDHKTLYYDVETFLFYVLTSWDAYGSHFVGYFSKEKNSMLEYNLSCIMTLPQFQRQGFGEFLIDFSYLLSRRERKLGSPEKPLSALGKVAYTKYWRAAAIKHVSHAEGPISIDDLATATGIQHLDITSSLNELGFLKKLEDGTVAIVVDPAVVKSNMERAERAKMRRSDDLVVDEALLRWTPPTERPLML